MKIKILSHDITDSKHIIDMRIEQEKKPFNSISQYIELSIHEVTGLSNDEIYTKSFYKVKDKAVEVFKKVSYDLEEFKPIGFELINSKATSIVLSGMSDICKEKDKDLKVKYIANVIDQYGNYMFSTEVSLCSDYEGLSMIDGELTIKSYLGEAKISANYESMYTEMILNITEKDKILTEQEILMNAVTELYEMIGGIK